MTGARRMEIEKLYRDVIPSRANKTGDWRLLTPVPAGRSSPCREGCLLDGEIPLWLEAVRGGRWAEAWEIMRRMNPFPAITGYVCFHPCTDECNRRQLDQEINIPAVERAVGLWRHQNYRPEAKPHAVRGRVAVVGSGPAGLSCAYYLNGEGYRVTILEQAPAAGGLLTFGIPHYRLPREILHRELEILQESGINLVLNCSLGRDVNPAQLYEEYDQVFLATGAGVSRIPSLAGADLSGVWNALDFLSRINIDRTVPIKGPVAVVGGGNAAVDAARSALRLKGISRVTILYRRGKEEMPADPHEVEAAAAEGVEFVFNVTPREITGRESVEKVSLNRSRTLGEELVIDPDNFSSHKCNTLIFAVGQEPDLSVFGQLPQRHAIFAGGDLISGPATVPEAIKAGRMAAAAIAAHLEGKTYADERPPSGKAVKFEELHLTSGAGSLPGGRRENPAEEAERCLGCGTCNACGNCYLFCPDVAVLVEQGQYTFDLDFCKGCGICARECPARALIMEGGS